MTADVHRVASPARDVEPGQARRGVLIEFPLLPEPATPELALVDPRLARLARARLYSPGDFRPGRATGPLHAPPERPRPAPQPVRAVAEASRHEPDRTLPPSSGRHRATAGRVVAVGAVLAVGSIGWLLGSPAGETPAVVVPAQRDASGAPPAARERRERPAPSAPSLPAASQGSSSENAPLAPSPSSRTFVWAPSPGARAYAIELFRGPRRILATTTGAPRLTVRRAWRAGDYRWYVWAIGADGLRGDKPLVQARLTVSG